MVGKRLYKRFDPVSEGWLRTIVPTIASEMLRVNYEPDTYCARLWSKGG